MKKHVKTTVVTITLAIFAGALSIQAEEKGQHPALAGAKANEWVKIGELNFRRKSGFTQGMLHVARSGRFVMLDAGRILELDLASGKWKQVPLKGKIPHSRDLARRGVYFQFASIPDSEQIFTYICNRTVVADLSTSEVKGLKGSPSPGANPECLLKAKQLGSYNGDHSHLIWGSLCYDPVNKEILSVGGINSSLAGTPGVWHYSLEKQAWRRGEFSDAQTKKTRVAIKALGERVWTLVSLARSRFFVSETAKEAKVDLAADAEKLAGELETQAGGIKDKRAADHLKQAAEMLKKVVPQLKDAIDAETIKTLTFARRRCYDATCALAAEPPARANSQMAYDASQKKIILFGGDGLDRYLSDTWVYDCASRTWTQRFPETAPRPRGGHALVYLPKSRRILLLGGYSGAHSSLPDMWVYDTAENKWSRIPDKRPVIGKGRNPWKAVMCAPMRGYHLPVTWPAAASEDDVVVMVDTGNTGPGKKNPFTYACRIDVSAGTDGGKSGVPGGTVHYYNKPFSWDRVAKPDPDAVRAKIDALKSNVWTHVPTPRDTTSHIWGTAAYDPERHQFLYWGGGHSGYVGTDVNHYSLPSGLWSGSFAPDTMANFNHHVLNGPGLLSFRNRPHIPVHCYQIYAYDPVSDLMVTCHFKHTFTYDVRRREWVGKPFRPPFEARAMRVSLATTPKGVVAWAGRPAPGLFLFDGAKRAWAKLPVSRNPGGLYCDSSGMCYDSKRDCLWLGGSGTSISRYDMKSGQLTRVTGSPKVLRKKGRGPTIREMTYVADQDLVLFMPVKSKNGKPANYCFDPEDGKWYWLEMPYMTPKGPRQPSLKYHGYPFDSAMNYDPEHKVVLLLHRMRGLKTGRIWLLKLDRKTAKMEEIVDPKPKTTKTEGDKK